MGRKTDSILDRRRMCAREHPPGTNGRLSPTISAMTVRETGAERIYADHHATTPIDPEVFEAMLPWLRGLAANPSSIHAPGREARKAIEAARAEVARGIGAEPEEIVFTSGGTESDHLGVRGGARAAREADPTRTRVLVTATEHAAVREAARALAGEGFTFGEIAVDGNGIPPAPALGTAFREDVALVSAILANNETGAVNAAFPELSARAHQGGVLVHTDAVQAVGKIPVDVKELGADYLSLTGHKLGGPKGAGALFVKKGRRLQPLLTGGGQEKGRRAGTENVPALVGLGAAVRVATARLWEEEARLFALRNRFEEGLRALWPTVRFNAAGAGASRLPTVSSAIIPGVEGETLLMALDLEGIAASSGSACAAGTTKPSHVLLATGLPLADVKSTLRFSFGRTTTGDELDRLLFVLRRVLAHFGPVKDSV